MFEIIMPKMGDAMTEGKVIRWYKKPGDGIKTGERVLEIETDKVNLDLEAEADGILGRIEVAEGEMAQVGGRLATIRGEGEAETPAAQMKTEPTPAPAPAVPTAKPAKEATVVEGGRIRSSPLARRMARDMGVELASLHGSGPGGRVIASDITAAAKSPTAGATPVSQAPRESRTIPLTAMRRTIAKRLAESTGPIPHFYLTIESDVTLLAALRKQFNEIEGIKVSVNDFIVRAAALTLRDHPNANASFMGESIVEHGSIHLGIAVSTPEGLITPVVRDADEKTIPEIANEVRGLAEKARNRKLKPDEYQGSTFTISNLGMYGIEEFTAIINPPNAAILAVGAAGPKPVVIDGQIVVRERMKMTLSCDHRVIDGAAGAEFLRTMQRYLEQPLRLIV